MLGQSIDEHASDDGIATVDEFPPRVWDVLRNSAFRSIFITDAVSSVGNFMQMAALAIFVAGVTGKAGWTAIVATAGMFGLGLAQPAGGMIADRWDRKTAVIIGTVVEALLAGLLALLFATGITHPALLAVVVVSQSIAWGLSSPALLALIPDVVESRHLAQSSVLGLTAWNAGRMVGPGLAVFCIAKLSYEVIFIVNGLSFICSALAVARVDVPRVRANVNRAHETRSPARGFLAGLNEYKNAPACRWATFLATAEVVLIAPIIATLAIAAPRLFHGKPSDASYFLTAQGIGGVAGTVALVWLLHHVSLRRVYIALLFGLPLCGLAYVSSHQLVIGVVCMGIFGCFYSGMLSCPAAIIQQHAPAHARGRIIAVHWALLNVLFAISSVALAAMADVFGLRTMLAITVTMMLAIVSAVALFKPNVWKLFD